MASTLSWAKLSAVLSRKPLLVAFDKLRVAKLQVLVADALTSSQQTIGELLWR